MFTDLLLMPRAGGAGGGAVGAGGGVTPGVTGGGQASAGMQAGFASVLAPFLGVLHGAGERAGADGEGLMWPGEVAEESPVGGGPDLNTAVPEMLSPEDAEAWEALVQMWPEAAAAVLSVLTGDGEATGDGGEQVPMLTPEQAEAARQMLAQALTATGDGETVPMLTRGQAQAVWPVLARALAATGDGEQTPALTQEQAQMVLQKLVQTVVNAGDGAAKSDGVPARAVTTPPTAQQTAAPPTSAQPVVLNPAPEMPAPQQAAEPGRPAAFTPLQGAVLQDEAVAGLVKPETAAAAEETAPQQATTATRAETPLVFPTGMEVREAAATETRSPAPMPTQAVEETVARQVIYRVLGELEQLRGQTGKMVRLELQLHPPELGRVVVRLLWRMGGLEARFLTGDQTVRGALEQALPQLREALGRQDVNLLDVSADLARDHEGEQMRRGPRGRGLVRYQPAHDEAEDSSRVPPQYGTARVIDRLA